LRFTLPFSRTRTSPRCWWVTPTLAVGGSDIASEPRRVRQLGIGAVLDLQAETADRSDRFDTAGIAYRKIAVADFHAPSQPQLEEASAWVLERMEEDRAVLVHCRAGVSRSFTVVLAILLRIGYGLPAAYNLVRKIRPELYLSDTQSDALRIFAAGLGRAVE
jgi:predicted protein tyrosine phosphatase